MKKYYKVICKTLSAKKRAVQILKHYKIKHCNNDTRDYATVIYGEKCLSPSEWWSIPKYLIQKKNKYSAHHNGITILTSINDIKCISDYGKIRCYRKLAWDIETKTYNCSYGTPVFDRVEPKDDGYDIIKQISMCFRWSDGEDMLSILLTLEEQDTSDDYYVILCKDQFELVYNFFKVISIYRPNFALSFNGMKFDWPMIMHRVKHKKSIEKNIRDIIKSQDRILDKVYDKNLCVFRNKNIKIDQQSNHNGICFMFLDCVDIDLRVCMLKELDYRSGDKANISNLNHYLKDNGLETKDDLGYDKIHAIFDSGDKAKMKLVGDYCIQDSKVLHLLEEKRNIILNIKGFADLTYTTFAEGYFKANTAKITNLTKSECYNNDYVYRVSHNMHYSNVEPYGAIVLDSNIGFYGYNSFDMDSYTNQLKEEIKATRNDNFRIDSISKNEYYISTINDPYLINLCKQCQLDNPPHQLTEPYTFIADKNLNANDFRSLYPSTAVTFNFCTSSLVEEKRYIKYNSPKGFIKFTFAGRTFYVKQHNYKDYAVTPKLILRVFNQRLEVKNKMKKLTGYNRTLLDVKQLALKIIINTMYGMFLYKFNTINYSEFIGQGICAGGRACLIMAKIIAEHYGCTVYYGDTDSIYFMNTDKHFKDIYDLYESRKIDIYDFKLKMLDRDKEVSKKISSNINSYLHDVVNWKHELIVPEETLINPLLVSKKMYAGTMEYDESTGSTLQDYYKYIRTTDKKKIDFYFTQTKIKKKGLPTQRRDKSGLQKYIMYELLFELSRPDISRTCVEITVDLLNELSEEKYDKKLFILHGNYKKNKQNSKNNMFVENMLEEYGETINDLEKFQIYVVNRPDYDMDLAGKRREKIGNKMVLKHIVEKNNYPLDFNYYKLSAVKMLGCLIYSNYQFGIIRDQANRKIEAINYLKNIIIKKRDRRKETTFNKRLYKKVQDDTYQIISFDFNKRLINHDDKLSFILDTVLQSVCDYVLICENAKIIRTNKLSLIGDRDKLSYESISNIENLWDFYREFVNNKYKRIQHIKETISIYYTQYYEILNDIKKNINLDIETIQLYNTHIETTIKNCRKSELYYLEEYDSILTGGDTNKKLKLDRKLNIKQHYDRLSIICKCIIILQLLVELKQNI